MGREERRIVDIFQRTTYHLRILEFQDQAGTVQRLETTDEHPFWVAAERDFVAAGELQVGDQFVGPAGELQALVATDREEHPEGVAVYNFEVEDAHTYFVRAHGLRAPPVLVHNATEGLCAPRGRLRARMGDPPSSMIKPQAHHDLPQAERFRPHWDRAGLDIDDPAFGRWVEGGPVGDHQKWSAAFNREWDKFFDANPMATREEILQRMNELRIGPRFQ